MKDLLATAPNIIFVQTIEDDHLQHNGFVVLYPEYVFLFGKINTISA